MVDISSIDTLYTSRWRDTVRVKKLNGQGWNHDFLNSWVTLHFKGPNEFGVIMPFALQFLARIIVLKLVVRE